MLGKGRKIRTVFFSFRAGQLLREYLSQREGGDALFAAVRAPWSPLTPGGIEKALARIGQRARGWNGGSTPISCGIPLLRRRCRVGCRCPVIQQLLGHEDPKTTMIYAAILPEAARRAYRKTFDRKENDQ